ncbi:hypothetical protein [Bordetella petrii]|uniref:hypothetical protein n=1 Tax=Bordetella petrii TaxID=94624 RepID=UPI003730A9DC
MSDFAFLSAFPQPAIYDPTRDQVNAAGAYGVPTGLNMQQHVWLTLYAAALSDISVTYEAAQECADNALSRALERLEQLA